MKLSDAPIAIPCSKTDGALLLEDLLDKRRILHDHRRPDFDKHPEKYDDNAWYAGALLLLGELVASP